MTRFRPWLVCLMPAVGALGAGLSVAVRARDARRGCRRDHRGVPLAARVCPATPIASLVMVCELAGSYDLLGPPHAGHGHQLHCPAQPFPLPRAAAFLARVASAPRRRVELLTDVLLDVRVVTWVKNRPFVVVERDRLLLDVRVGDVTVKDRPFVVFERDTPAVEVVQRVAAGGWQDVFPALSEDKSVVGVITSDVLRTVMREPELANITIAEDLMMPPSSWATAMT